MIKDSSNFWLQVLKLMNFGIEQNQDDVIRKIDAIKGISGSRFYYKVEIYFVPDIDSTNDIFNISITKCDDLFDPEVIDIDDFIQEHIEYFREAKLNTLL